MSPEPRDGGSVTDCAGNPESKWHGSDALEALNRSGAFSAVTCFEAMYVHFYASFQWCFFTRTGKRTCFGITFRGALSLHSTLSLMEYLLAVDNHYATAHAWRAEVLVLAGFVELSGDPS